MTCLLPQRQQLGIRRCQDPTLPLTSFCWQQNRRVFNAAVNRNNTCICVKGNTYDEYSTSAYENDLHMVTTLRKFFHGVQIVNKESLWSNRCNIEDDQKWVNHLEATLDFYYINRRLPKPGEERDNFAVGNWLRRHLHANYCLDEKRPCNVKITPKMIGILQSMSWWHPREAAWQFKFEEVVEYAEVYGEVPPENHPTLGRWVRHQRRAHTTWRKSPNEKPKKGKHAENYTYRERVEKLESVPGWWWDAVGAWEV